MGRFLELRRSGPERAAGMWGWPSVRSGVRCTTRRLHACVTWGTHIWAGPSSRAHTGNVKGAASPGSEVAEPDVAHWCRAEKWDIRQSGPVVLCQRASVICDTLFKCNDETLATQLKPENMSRLVKMRVFFFNPFTLFILSSCDTICCNRLLRPPFLLWTSIVFLYTREPQESCRFLLLCVCYFNIPHCCHFMWKAFWKEIVAFIVKPWQKTQCMCHRFVNIL